MPSGRPKKLRRQEAETGVNQGLSEPGSSCIGQLKQSGRGADRRLVNCSGRSVDIRSIALWWHHSVRLSRRLSWLGYGWPERQQHWSGYGCAWVWVGQKDKGKEQWCELGTVLPWPGRKLYLMDVFGCMILSALCLSLTELSWQSFYPYFRQGECRVQGSWIICPRLQSL